MLPSHDEPADDMTDEAIDHMTPPPISPTNHKPRLDLLSSKEAAAYLHLSTKTLARHRHAGTGPVFIRLSRNVVMYERQDLDAWVKALKQETQAR